VTSRGREEEEEEEEEEECGSCGRREWMKWRAWPQRQRRSARCCGDRSGTRIRLARPSSGMEAGAKAEANAAPRARISEGRWQ
jgi:hypothetical protein